MNGDFANFLQGFSNPQRAEDGLLGRELAQGRPLVIVDAGSHMVAEIAAHLAIRLGRTDDLRVIELTTRGTHGGESLRRLGRSEREADDAEALLARATSLLGRDPIEAVPPRRQNEEALHGILAFDGREANPVPFLDPADLSRERLVLILRAETRTLSLARRLVLRTIVARLEADVPIPGIVCEMAPFGPEARALGLSYVQHGLRSLAVTQAMRARIAMPPPPPAAAIPTGEPESLPGGVLRLVDGPRTYLAAAVASGRLAIIGASQSEPGGWWHVRTVSRGSEGIAPDASHLREFISRLQGGKAVAARIGLSNAVTTHPDCGAQGLLASKDPGVGALARIANETGDLELQAACEASGAPPMTWTWVRKGADPKARARRRQFAMAWPILADFGPEREITEAVDAARPVAEILAEHTRLPRSILRRLSGMRARPRFAVWVPPASGGYVHFPDLMRALGPDRIPSGTAAWEALCTCVDLAVLALLRPSTSAQLPARRILDLVLPLGRDWPERRHAAEAIPRVELGDVADMVFSLARALAQAADLSGQEARLSAMGILGSHGSLTELHATSRRWHAHPVLSWSEAAEVPPDLAWPRAFGPAELGGGWSALALASAAEFRDEGRHGPGEDGREGLRHCVAGYARSCYEGRSLVVGLRCERAGAPERVTTAELVADPEGDLFLGGRGFRLGQHRARANGAPPSGAVEAMARLVEGLRAGTVPVDPAGVAERDFQGHSVPIAAHDILELWRPLLPRRWGLPPDALVAQIRAALAEPERPVSRGPATVGAVP